MGRTTVHHVTLAAVILLVAATLWRLGHVELRGEEPRRAVVALEMIDSGEYVVPHMSGHTYYNKPPVFNWLVAASLGAFPGTESWMVRLPSLVSFWLIGLFTFVVTDRFVDRRAALWSALFYLTGGELLFYGTVMTGELDLFYSLVVFLQAGSMFWFLRRGQWALLFVVSYALAAAGFLTKGLPSIAFQGLTIVGTLAAFGHTRRLFDPRHLLGVATFAGIVGGYLYLYSLREPVTPFLVALVEEASQRTGLESELGELLHGTVSFPAVLAKLLLPWSLLAVWLFRKSAWARLWGNPWTRFCLVFCAVNMPLYWFSGELRNRYLYTFFPFVVAPLAAAFATQREERLVLARWTDRVAQAILLLLVVGALIVPWVDPFRDFGGVKVAGFLWAIATAGILVAHRRREELRVPLFALALVIARLAFDVAYLPAMNLSRVSGYPPHVERILEITGGGPVHLAGEPEYLIRDAAIGPVRLGAVEYTIPPRLAYQISWHYARLAGTPILWREEPQPGDWCLVAKAAVDTTRARVRHEFHDHWIDRDLALVQWPGVD